MYGIGAIILGIIAFVGFGMKKEAQSNDAAVTPPQPIVGPPAPPLPTDVTTPNSDFTHWDSLFQKYSDQYDVPFIWLKGICMNESSLGTAPSVVYGFDHPSDRQGSASDDGLSWGLMQVTETTGRDFDASCTFYKLNDPDYSVNIASQYLARAAKQFDTSSNDYEKNVIMSYNGGIRRVQLEITGEWQNLSPALQVKHRNAIANAAEYWARYRRNKTQILSLQPEYG